MAKRGKYKAKYATRILRGFSVADLAEHLNVGRKTAYNRVAAAMEVLDAVAEMEANQKQNISHEKHEPTPAA